MDSLELLGRVYEAPAEAAGWTPVLEGISEALRTPVLVLRIHAPARGDPEVWRAGTESAGSLPVAFARETGSHGSQEALRLGAGVAPKRGSSPFEPEAPLVQFRLRIGDPGGTLDGWRAARTGEYGEGETALLRTLGPHLARSIRLRRRLLEAERGRSASCGALDRLPLGVMLVDASRRLLMANPKAREILAPGDGLVAVRGEIRCARARDSSLLRQAIARAASAEGGGSEQPAFLCIERVSGKRPYGVAVAPLTPPARGVAGGGGIALYVSDPEAGAVVDAEALEHLYGLTPTEARIVATLAGGDSPEEAADRLRMRLGTLRFHLKHVFAKTGTNRQPSLIGLVLGGPGSIRRV